MQNTAQFSSYMTNIYFDIQYAFLSFMIGIKNRSKLLQKIKFIESVSAHPTIYIIFVFAQSG